MRNRRSVALGVIELVLAHGDRKGQSNLKVRCLENQVGKRGGKSGGNLPAYNVGDVPHLPSHPITSSGLAWSFNNRKPYTQLRQYRNSSTSVKEGITHTKRLENVDFASKRGANNLCGSLGQT